MATLHGRERAAGYMLATCLIALVSWARRGCRPSFSFCAPLSADIPCRMRIPNNACTPLIRAAQLGSSLLAYYLSNLLFRSGLGTYSTSSDSIPLHSCTPAYVLTYTETCL